MMTKMLPPMMPPTMPDDSLDGAVPAGVPAMTLQARQVWLAEGERDPDVVPEPDGLAGRQDASHVSADPN